MTEASRSPPQWNYALRVYAHPGVSEACLELQARCGVDVVVMLHAMYAFDVLGIRLDTAALESADASVRAWREQVTHPLRSLRTFLKFGFEGMAPSDVENVRGGIKAAELASESAAFAALSVFTEGIPADRRDPAEVEKLLFAIVGVYNPFEQNGGSAGSPAHHAVQTLRRILCTLASDRPSSTSPTLEPPGQR